MTDRSADLLFPGVAHYYREPLTLVRGTGSWVVDAEGREYLDLFGGILTVSLGHAQPEVVDAIVAQARTLCHTSTLYRTPPMLAAAEQLARSLPAGLQRSYFVASGSEANEVAVLLARLHTGHHEIVCLHEGYSGRTMLGMAMNGNRAWRHLPVAASGVVHAPSPYCYRCPLGLAYPSCDLRCAQQIRHVIECSTTGAVAGMLAEPIQGVGGFITPPAGYFELAGEIVREFGGLMIADEIQTGLGRTGGDWLASERWSCAPDIVTLAKGLANGMPAAAVVTRDEIAAALPPSILSTFGANPVSMAAAAATMAIIADRRIPEHAARLGLRLAERLASWRERFACVGDVRGRGLMQAIELVEDRQSKRPATELAARVMERAREAGVLLGRSGRWGQVLRIAPPMLISASDLDDGCARLETILGDP